jgi:DNA topoisomerase-1
MAKNLVIVESPTKAKTIEKYLGADYKVLASVGHVRDLPRSDFAVEVQGDQVALRYEVPKSSSKVVSTIKREAKTAERVYLATDLDREGEAIAWHVAEVAGIDTGLDNRVVFSEITRDAILAAFRTPRRIDDHLVDAQQARRAVDRIVGYRLSPTLWRNVSAGISAGRVQSVALRLIVDREEEIRRFVPQEYWTVTGDFAKPDDAGAVSGELHAYGGRRVVTPKKMEEYAERGTAERYLVVGDQEMADLVTGRAREVASWTVTGVTRKETTQSPKPPFTTSTLQQDAGNRLGFSAQKTMRVAQQLYEGIAIGAEGQVGLITYMRTDSVNLSQTALNDIAQTVADQFGERYTIAKPRTFKSTSKGAQEAHEAIRPTSMARTPQRVAGHLDADQRALYELIWRRTAATQMAPAVFDTLRADLVGQSADDTELVFRASGRVRKFDGYLRALGSLDDAGAELPDLDDDQVLSLADVRADQHFTEPPPRYNQGSLIKLLEDEGIGRPSTYASIIQVLLQREYVRLESRAFRPTPLGEVVTTYLKQHFAEVVDVSFTARMEDELDEIARGDHRWGPMVSDFLTEVDDWISERKPERPRIPLDGVECPECGSAMQKVWSGKSRQWFASCERFPDCKGSLPLDEYGNVTTVEALQPDESVPCPVCGKATIRRDGRYGPFYGCQDYPTCKGIVNVERQIGFACPKCGEGHLTERTSRYGKPFYGCNRYPDCDFAMWTQPLAQPCPNCGGPLKPPRRNAKDPVAVCANCEEKVQVESDPPRAESYEFVPGRRESIGAA